MTDKTVKATVLKDFRDAGTEEEFAKGDARTLSEGTFKNYEAAGLVAKEGSDAAKATKADGKPDA